MRNLILIIAFVFNSVAFGQLSVGIKLGGLAFHHKKVSPNYYKLSIDKKGHWVGYFSISMTAGYQFNPYLGVKLIQTIMPYDCAGKFSGITHLGIDFFDRILGAKNNTHRFSGSFGPIFYYRKNWKEVPNYYIAKGLMKTGKNKAWERKFIWYGAQVQYDYYLSSKVALSTTFLPGYPQVYTFNTGIQTTF